ncbi:MAG TPA: hypothetical protein VIJ82_15195 [Streptosporangiaceae bacterium]
MHTVREPGEQAGYIAHERRGVAGLPRQRPPGLAPAPAADPAPGTEHMA